MTSTATHCPYCALQCGMELSRPDPGALVEVAPLEFPTNRGGLCQKGWTAAELLDSPKRLTTPLMRTSRSAAFDEVSWDEALDAVVAGIRSAQRLGGPDAVGVLGGGGLTNEKAYQLGKFARVALGTKNIDYNGRYCMSSAAAASNRAFGIDRGLPFHWRPGRDRRRPRGGRKRRRDHAAVRPAPRCGGDEHAVEMAVTRLRGVVGSRIVQTVVKRGYQLAYEPESSGDKYGTAS